MKPNLRNPAVLLLALAACAVEPPAEPQRNILLVTADTLRADALGFGGASPDASPMLDRLAAESVVFLNAYTQSTVTHPSLSSIMTGLIPPRHGVGQQQGKLRSSVVPVAQVAQRRGYATGAFVANMCQLLEIENTVLHDGWGERFCGMDLTGESHGIEQYQWDEAVVTAAKGWIEQQEGPWFAWVHLMDPHGEHRPAPDLWDYEAHDPGDRRSQDQRRSKFEHAREIPGPEELEKLRKLYAAEVLGTDRLVGSLVDFVDALPEESQPALLFVADHGEELYETWSKEGHGFSLTEGVLHVPLLARIPGVEPRVSDAYVNTLQVAPTLLELMGAAPRPFMDGASLLEESPSDGFAVSFHGSVATLRAEGARFYWDVPKLRSTVKIDPFAYYPHFQDAPWFQSPVLMARYAEGAPHQPSWQSPEDDPLAKELHEQLEWFVERASNMAARTGEDEQEAGQIKAAAFEEELRALGYMGDEPTE